MEENSKIRNHAVNISAEDKNNEEVRMKTVKCHIHSGFESEIMTINSRN